MWTLGGVQDGGDRADGSGRSAEGGQEERAAQPVGRGLTEVPQNVYRLNVDTPEEAKQNLHDNQLKSLPGALGELQELQQLRLSHNKLTTLPVELCSLQSLRILTVQQNQLESLPEELGQLKNLTELALRYWTAAKTS
ncbi:hypothetical protein INR49_008313 [Caranx melampygus]|nr:hypothetical protein INR49_008313 [Caranx melampygus]